MENTAKSGALSKPYSKNDCDRIFGEWKDLAAHQADATLGAWMNTCHEGSDAYALMSAICGNSPYLSRLLLLHPDTVRSFFEQGADTAYQLLIAEFQPIQGDQKELMRHLRIYKGKLALLVALADVSGSWRLEQVTLALTEFAERALHISTDYLLGVAQGRSEIELPTPAAPSVESGIVILGMGKLGGFELNYSSDIDLIIFFTPGRLNYKGRHNEQHFMNKFAHDLVQLMQERTADGYVFRTDLRLRPDPASTPPAVTINAAYYYYESVGQNWERAAMIKARAVAGDIKAGEEFLKGLTPFMWRRNLDFASINDIHSIKRQMDTRQHKYIKLASHNIKLGIGGIREIEFYTQIHQLIWGGRETKLRSRNTCETLRILSSMGLIDAAKESTMIEGYHFLRKLEHRLQMVADEQTHTLPETPEDLTRIAYFMGYNNLELFEKDVTTHLHKIHDIYASSFRGAEKLGDEGNLVFTGSMHDPDTLATLRNMGYQNPETVSELVMGWHHGACRATRTKRARELLTELMPALLKRLGETANADAAFLKFNEFLLHLPAGVQLFSLFNNNPQLLGLIADIMGSAPMLADTLARSPELLDAVLYEDFYRELPNADTLNEQIDILLSTRQDLEERMEALCEFRNEKQFQAGVQLLKGMITAQETGKFLAVLAQCMIERTLIIITAEFTQTYGTIPGNRFAIIALGKLGSREMTFSSDIDLVFVYDVPDFDAVSDGEKGFSASVYYNRFVQRLVNALSAMGRQGRLYEVDTRLRPSGKQGLLAVSIQALGHYFEELAWTFEYMAFTKARVAAGEATLAAELEAFITSQINKPRDQEKLRLDVADMRERVDKQHHTENLWDIKYVRGGLIDVDFVAQYLLLHHAPTSNLVAGDRPLSASEIFSWCSERGFINAEKRSMAQTADRFMGQIFNTLRLTYDRDFSETGAPAGLKKLICISVHEQNWDDVKKRLGEVEQSVYAYYKELLAP